MGGRTDLAVQGVGECSFQLRKDPPVKPSPNETLHTLPKPETRNPKP